MLASSIVQWPGVMYFLAAMIGQWHLDKWKDSVLICPTIGQIVTMLSKSYLLGRFLEETGQFSKVIKFLWGKTDSASTPSPQKGDSLISMVRKLRFSEVFHLITKQNSKGQEREALYLE